MSSSLKKIILAGVMMFGIILHDVSNLPANFDTSTNPAVSQLSDFVPGPSVTLTRSIIAV